jgi:uncharacterized protein YndB with AHSA1/START domain
VFAGSGKRIDSASRLIHASARSIYRAYLDPGSLAVWLPPTGMSARVEAFDPREGGRYRLVLTYNEANHAVPGKTSEHADVVVGRFLELAPNERIVQSVEFVSEEADVAGEMRVSWLLAPKPQGTEVTILCEDVPPGIRREDHEMGFRSTLDNLAAFLEREPNA